VALSLGVKWPGPEADYSPSSNDRIKNAWNYTSTLTIRLNDVVLIYSTGTTLPLLVPNISYFTELRSNFL